MSIAKKKKAYKPKDIDYGGQYPYSELPLSTDTINNNKKNRSFFIVFEGFEKKYKFIKIENSDLYKDTTEGWESLNIWTPDIVLKNVLFTLYLDIWANMYKLQEDTKLQLKADNKIDDYKYKYILFQNNKINIENYIELKIVLKKLLDNKIKRVYIVYRKGDVLHAGEIIKKTLKSRGYTEWVINNKNSDDINVLATKFFSLSKMNKLRTDGAVYIKKFIAKYKKQLADEKNNITNR
jgi:hypothetical protein